MPGPPFLAEFGFSDGEVLPVGKWTCPYCQTEADGGDPASWSVAATHAQLVTMQQDNTVNITVSGVHTISWQRVIITEGGDAASCAYRRENYTGQLGTVNYSFSNPLAPSEGVTCLPLASGAGVIAGSGATTLYPATDTANIANTDNQTGSALCSSTGCTSGDFGAYNSDNTGTMTTQYVGASYLEKFCRDTSGTYRYTFTGQVDISGDGGPSGPGMQCHALLYTGTFDIARWPTFSLPLDPEFTLSAETTVGTVRGISIKAKYITFSVDHAASTISGSAGSCPLPSYSSDVTTGTTTGTISCTVSG